MSSPKIVNHVADSIMKSWMRKNPFLGVVGLDVGTRFVGVVMTKDCNTDIYPVGCYVKLRRKHVDYYSSICKIDKSLSFLMATGSAGDGKNYPGLGFITGYPSASPYSLVCRSWNQASVDNVTDFMNDWDIAAQLNQSPIKYFTYENEFGSTKLAKLLLGCAYTSLNMKVPGPNLRLVEKKREDVMSAYIILRKFTVSSGVSLANFDDFQFALKVVSMRF